MRKKFILGTALLLLLSANIIFITACTQGEIDKVGAYTTIIDKIYNEGITLNENIKYLALDTTSIVNLNDEEKATLLKELEIYGFEVLNKTSKELETEGYIDENHYFKEGILIHIKDELMKRNRITMDISKFRGMLGANGFENAVLKFSYGKWKISKIGSRWVS